MGKGRVFRFGNITVYWRMGKLVIRERKNVVKKTKRSKKQKKTNVKFTGERRMYSAMRAVLLDHPTWKCAARLHGGRTSDNFFFTTNHKYMTNGEVSCFALFRFSLGELALPWDLKAMRGEHGIAITWTDVQEHACSRGSDRLLVGLFHEQHPDRPVLVDTGATRAHRMASVQFDPKYGEGVHIYPFFEREDKTAYSEDQYFDFGCAPEAIATENEEQITASKRKFWKWVLKTSQVRGKEKLKGKS